jgi:hypothetical protein
MSKVEMVVFWDAAFALKIEAVITCETSLKHHQTTRRNIPEDSQLHTRRRENLKSHPANSDHVGTA